MRILHTSDWHVGKVLKGRNRQDEHIKVLAQVVEIAQAERPDLVIVAGDLYDTAAPTADATRLVTRALSALRKTGARVVAIGGNHDNGAALDALRPWADAAGIELRGSYPKKKGDLSDLLIEGTTESGERWRLVALPFLSQRYAIRAAEMYELSAAEANQTYADLVARLIAKLSEPFAETGVVNLLTAHLTIVGASTGGGEREAHTIMGYAVPATVFRRTRTTSPSATCTAPSRSSRRARRGTAAARSPSTSARRRTSARSRSWTSPPTRPPGSGTCR